MYFNTLPLVEYGNLQDTTTTNQYKIVLTNILTRSAFLQEIVENSAIFYEYQIKDGETPEIIADKLYGDVGRFWIVLLFNKLSNPFYDFPLIQEQLNDMVTAKYGTDLAIAMSTIHHYEERITHTTLFNDMVQSQEENVYQISYYTQDPITGNIITRNYQGSSAIPNIPDTCLDGPSTTDTFANGVSVIRSTKYCSVSNYTYEFEENEKRRSIKLLDKDYVLRVENEFKRLMADGN
jgi:hypothetical protein